jgi:hypothetical protein
MGDQVRVNGEQVSWGSIKVKINGDPYYGFDSIAYGDKRERAKSYGMGKHHAPRGRSRGKYTTEPVKLRGPKSSVEALRAALASAATDGLSYGNTLCEIVVQFVEANETPMNVVISECLWVSDQAAHEEGVEILKEEIELDCMAIRRNGKTLFDATSGQVPV